MSLISFRLVVLVGVSTLASSSAFSDWPEKPVKIVVSYVSGAMDDVVSRLLSEELRNRLGQPVIVEKRTIVKTNIGTAALVQSPADGYTLVAGATNTFVINQIWSSL